jgi:hypothetical protein
MKTYSLDIEAMIPWFKKAVTWYAENGPKNIPRPSTLPEGSFKNVELTGRASWGVYFMKNDELSYIDDASVMLKGVSTHMLPLFAGVHQGFEPYRLAKIIEHHGIEPADFHNIYLTRQGQSQLFTSKDGIQIGLLEFYIETWKAFEILGKVSDKDGISAFLQIAVMNTECKEAWPATLIEQQAAVVKSGKADRRTFENDFKHRWEISRKTQFPYGNSHEFMRRSGMLSRPAFRKEVSLHHAWESLIIIAGHSGERSVAWGVLEDCKKARAADQQLIRDALHSMHNNGMKDPINGHPIFKMLKLIFEDSDLKDVLDSVILKINVTVPRSDASNYAYYMQDAKELFSDILESGQQVLSKACQEILSLEPHQIGYAHFVFFNTLGRMELGPQELTGFSPESVIQHLDKALVDFLGSRSLDGDMAKRVIQGPSSAFKELGKYHQWDFSKLQECSSLTQFLLVQEGANLRNFPAMDKKHRGLLLEDQLGL